MNTKKNIIYKISIAVIALMLFSNIPRLLNVEAHTGTSCGTNDQESTDGRHCSWSPNNSQFYFYLDGGGYYWTDSMQLRWNQASANALKNTSHRYTQDNNDGGATGTAHFSATGNWGTTFPNPAFDTDDDWGNDCSYANEAEITADNSNFPTPDTNYLTTYQWQRSCAGTGKMYYTAQLSTWFLEWQTRHWDQLYTHNYSYSGAMNRIENPIAFIREFINSASAHSADHNPIKIDKGLYSYTVQRKANSSEVNVNVNQNINSKQDLVSYKKLIDGKANELKNKNISSVRAIITFNFPQSIDDFKRLINNLNIDVESFKIRAVSSYDRTRVTIGGTRQDNIIDPVSVFEAIKNAKAMKTLGDIELGGMISIDGKISLNDYEGLISDPSVFLVDVLPEIAEAEIGVEKDISLNSGERTDINVNDVYWHLEEYGK